MALILKVNYIAGLAQFVTNLGPFCCLPDNPPAKAPLLFHFAPIYPSDGQLLANHSMIDLPCPNQYDWTVRYEIGGARFVWAEYKPEGFSVFGRRIVSDCGQNSPPGFNTKLEGACFGNPSKLKLCYFQKWKDIWFWPDVALEAFSWRQIEWLPKTFIFPFHQTFAKKNYVFCLCWSNIKSCKFLQCSPKFWIEFCFNFKQRGHRKENATAGQQT